MEPKGPHDSDTFIDEFYASDPLHKLLGIFAFFGFTILFWGIIGWGIVHWLHNTNAKAKEDLLKNPIKVEKSSVCVLQERVT